MSNFIFRDVDSATYGLRIASIGGGATRTTPAFPATTIVKDVALKRLEPYIYTYRLSDEISFPMQIFHKNGKGFRQNELRVCQEWLFASQHPGYLTILDPDKGDSSYLCKLINPSQQLIGNYVVGWDFTVACALPYSISNIEERKYNNATGAEEFTFYNLGDIDDYNYPQLHIKMLGNSTYVRIENVTDNNRVFQITDLPTGIEFDVDNDLEFMKATDPTVNIFQHFNLNWFRLSPGMNRFQVTGECEITLRTRFKRAIGGY